MYNPFEKIAIYIVPILLIVYIFNIQFAWIVNSNDSNDKFDIYRKDTVSVMKIADDYMEGIINNKSFNKYDYYDFSKKLYDKYNWGCRLVVHSGDDSYSLAGGYTYIDNGKTIINDISNISDVITRKILDGETYNLMLYYFDDETGSMEQGAIYATIDNDSYNNYVINTYFNDYEIANGLKTIVDDKKLIIMNDELVK